MLQKPAPTPTPARELVPPTAHKIVASAASYLRVTRVGVLEQVTAICLLLRTHLRKAALVYVQLLFCGIGTEIEQPAGKPRGREWAAGVWATGFAAKQAPNGGTCPPSNAPVQKSGTGTELLCVECSACDICSAPQADTDEEP